MHQWERRVKWIELLLDACHLCWFSVLRHMHTRPPDELSLPIMAGHAAQLHRPPPFMQVSRTSYKSWILHSCGGDSRKLHVLLCTSQSCTCFIQIVAAIPACRRNSCLNDASITFSCRKIRQCDHHCIHFLTRMLLFKRIMLRTHCNVTL